MLIYLVLIIFAVHSILFHLSCLALFHCFLFCSCLCARGSIILWCNDNTFRSPSMIRPSELFDLFHPNIKSTPELYSFLLRSIIYVFHSFPSSPLSIPLSQYPLSFLSLFLFLGLFSYLLSSSPTFIFLFLLLISFPFPCLYSSFPHSLLYTLHYYR